MSSIRKQIWVLVLFDEEKVLSHPIPLGEVQDLSGRNGEEADLREGDECMAQYYVGDSMRKATILKRSENREELNEVYKEMLGIAKENKASQQKSTFWGWTKKVGAGILVGGAAVAAAPVVLSAAGFSSGGIVAGSVAARLMSMAAIANGGGVAAGGWIAACQSAGAAGISATTNLIIGTTAGAAGTFAASKLSKKEEAQEEQSFEDMCSKLKEKSPGNPQTGCCSAQSPIQEAADPPSNSDTPSPETLEADQPSPIPPENSLSPDHEEVDNLISLAEGINLDAQEEAERLYHENQRLHEEKQCKICMDAEMDTLFTPCGHLCTCRRCADKLKDCPICKLKIQQLHRVYKS